MILSTHPLISGGVNVHFLPVSAPLPLPLHTNVCIYKITGARKDRSVYYNTAYTRHILLTLYNYSTTNNEREKKTKTVITRK